MKARLLSNAITTGHVARDYLRQIRNPSTTDTPPEGQGAQEVLESFREHNSPVSVGFVPPVKDPDGGSYQRSPRNEAIHGIGTVTGEIGPRLYKGCVVKLVGIPERAFFVADIFWDNEEVRIIEPATGIEYVVPWDCLRLAEEQDT